MTAGHCARCDTQLLFDMKEGSFFCPKCAGINEAAPQPVPLPALATQVGGLHYKKCKIQPVEYVHANGIGYFEGTAIKYLTRWKDKGGIEDLKKAIHFIEILIELETTQET